MTFALFLIAASVVAAPSDQVNSETRELTVDDFTFEGPLGSEGTTIEKIDTNHFKVSLGSAPGHPDWNNKLQFTIKQNAKGNSLRLDVVFLNGEAYRFNEYFHSWSYDNENWNPVHWEHQSTDSKKGDTLLFPQFTEDRVYVGHQVPMSYEKVVELVTEWEKNPYVTVHILGKSLGGRNLYRLEITDPDSPIPASDRWVHYFGNQHPGEHNSQWRMVGMIDWLLGEEGAGCLRHSISHFVLMMSPDAPSKGWYRVSAQGVDQNRSYLVEGSNKEQQPHEAYICQKDLENLMASESPVTDAWSMHTWGGVVEPIAHMGPEAANQVGPWTELRDLIEKNDPKDLVEPLKVRDPGNPTYWSSGTYLQFGITSVLCEGAGAIYTKEDNIESGKVLMKGIAEYYRDTKSTASYRNSKVLDCFLNVADEMEPKLPWKAKTEEEHCAWQKELKAKLVELLGRMPEAVPLEVEWTEKMETDLFTRHKVYIRSEKYYWIPAYYFVPKNIKEKRPAIVCLHGHSGILPYIREGDEAQLKKCKEHALDYAVYLAEHGYVTIAPVLRGWNETCADPDTARDRSCRRVSMDTFLTGMTPMGLKNWDAMRCVDFLVTQNEVDASRIGAGGLSGGGTLTMYLPILDERVKLAMVAGAFSSYRASIYAIRHCICNCLPHVMEWGEMSDVMAVQAPMPLLLINGIHDRIFPIKEAREGYERLKKVYALLGVPDRLDADFFDGPHSWSNNKTLPFLAQHFGPIR